MWREVAQEIAKEYPEIETVSLKPSRTKKEGTNSKNGNTKTTQKGTGKNFTNQAQRAIVEVNIGEIDKVRPNQLVVFFHDELKIHREHFGKIVIKKKYQEYDFNIPYCDTYIHNTISVNYSVDTFNDDKDEVNVPCYNLHNLSKAIKQHKGYGTKAHLEALEKFGPCKIHRKTYGPVSKYFSKQLAFDFEE